VFSISRKLNIAGKGIYGFGSCLTRVGDVVAILGGGRTPVVLHLRFDSSDRRRYFDASCEGRNTVLALDVGCGDIFSRDDVTWSHVLSNAVGRLSGF
jgi:hypothetical protein